MSEEVRKSHTALQEGIKTAGIGKKGSQDLSSHQIQAICEEIEKKIYAAESLGALLGGLITKGVSSEEKELETVLGKSILSHPSILVEQYAADVPDDVMEFLLKILKGQTLDEDQAEKLGNYLFSKNSNLFSCGLAASILRVRYETPEEYQGLLTSATKTFRLKTLLKQPKPLIQIADPFDGVDHSYMITPLIAEHFRKKGFISVLLCGENSGPKFGNNLYDVAKELKAGFIKNIEDLKRELPLGLYLSQENLSPAMHRWVKIRRNTVKRPFLSTIERFVDPFIADIHIASAFHPPYGEKMISLCETQEFPAAIIIRNGMEGTTAFPLMRSAKILCTVRKSDGEYVRHEIEFNPKTELNINVDKEERIENPNPQQNAELIQKHLQSGASGNTLFDLRVKATTAGLDKALEWIKENQK